MRLALLADFPVHTLPGFEGETLGHHATWLPPLARELESRTGDWGRWLAHHGFPGLRPPGMLFDQFATLTQGAIHGMGAALIPTFLIQRELSEGRLIPIFGPPVPALGSYYLVWPNTLTERLPLRSLRLWLQAEVTDPALTPAHPPATLGPKPEAP